MAHFCAIPALVAWYLDFTRRWDGCFMEENWKSKRLTFPRHNVRRYQFIIESLRWKLSFFSCERSQ